MKILHLIDSLDESGSARQLQVLGPALARGATSVEICCLGPETPATALLRQAGVIVHSLQWTRWIDLGVLWKLREIVHGSAADVIHVWRLPALRMLAAVARGLLPRVVMSAPLPAQGGLAWCDRWLLQQVRCLAVAGVSDQERCLRHGITRPALRVVPPTISEPERQRGFAEDGLAGARARKIVCAGKLEREFGFRNAIWAFDILCQVYADMRLNLVGTGSQQPALRALAAGLQNDTITFLGEQADRTTLLQDAEIVWIPSLANHGQHVALEAMALGRAVIASDVPCLRDVILDGETGYLVPPGDVAQLARRTYSLIQDRALRERIGQAARQSVLQRFPLADAMVRWHDVYRSIAA